MKAFTWSYFGVQDSYVVKKQKRVIDQRGWIGMGIRHAGNFYMHIVRSSDSFYHLLKVKLKVFMAKSGHERSEKHEKMYNGEQST